MKRALLVSLFVSQAVFANALFDYSLKKAQEEEVRKAIELENKLIKILRYRIEIEHNTTMPSKELLKTKYGIDLGDSITISSDDNISNIIIRNNQIINNPALKSIYDKLQKDRPEFVNKTQGNEINLSLKTPLSLQGILIRTKLIKDCDNNKTTERDGTTAVMICGGVAYDVIAIDGEWRALNFTSLQELKSGSGSSSVIAKYSIKELVDSCKTLKTNQTIRMDFDYYNIFNENLRNMEFAKVVETNSTDINRTYCVGIKFGKSYFLASDLKNLPINKGEYNNSEAWLSDIKYIYDDNYTCPANECGIASPAKEKYAHIVVSDKNTSWVVAADSMDELSMALSTQYSNGFKTTDGNITQNLLGKVGRSRSGLVYEMKKITSSSETISYYWDSKDANSSKAQYRFIARNITDLPTGLPGPKRPVNLKDNGVATIGGIISNGVHNNSDTDNISAKYEAESAYGTDYRWSLVLQNLVALAELKGSSFANFLDKKDNYRIMIDFNNNLTKDGNDRYMVLGSEANSDNIYWVSTENPIDIFLIRDRNTIPSEFYNLSPEEKKRVKFFTIINDCTSTTCYGEVNNTNISRGICPNCSSGTYANYYAGDLNATSNLNLYHYVDTNNNNNVVQNAPRLKHKNNLTDLVYMTHIQAYNFKDLNVSDINGTPKATYDNPNVTYPHAFLYLNKDANEYQKAIKKIATANLNRCIDYYNTLTSGSFSGTCGNTDDGVYFAIGNMGITKKQGILWSETINFPTGITYQTAEFAGDSNTSPLKVGFVYQFTNCWYGQTKGCGTSANPAHGVSPIGQKVLISNPLNSFNNFCFQKRFEGQASQLPNVSKVWWQRGADSNCSSLLTFNNKDAIYVTYGARNNLPTIQNQNTQNSIIRDNNISLLSANRDGNCATLYYNRPVIFTLRYDDISKNPSNPHFFYRWIDDVCSVGGSYVVNSLTNLCKFDSPEDANKSNHLVYTTKLGNKTGIFDAALINFEFNYFNNNGMFKGFIFRGVMHQPQHLRHYLSSTIQPQQISTSSGTILYKAFDANFWFRSDNLTPLNGCYLQNLSNYGIYAYATKNNFVDFGHYNPTPNTSRRYCYTTTYNGNEVPVAYRRVNVHIYNINTQQTSICSSPGFCYNTSWPSTQPW